ncbi:MAG: LytR/AlgR family response regulator transcription factor [Bacteroidia bacterium]
MELRVILVDDENDSLEVLRNLLKKFCQNVTIVGEANNIKDAYDLIVKEEPDAVFLDVQMPGGNGFNLLKKFPRVPFDVVFITSYDRYAIDAIKLSALHYLLKPIEVEFLQEAVKRIEKSAYWKDLFQVEIQNAIDNMETVHKRIAVHSKGQVTLLKMDEITHFESDRNYTNIYTTDNKYISSKNLGEYEEMLKEQQSFYRVNKSCIVNLSHITNYTKEEPCIITINKQYEQEVSRRKKQEIMELIKLKR